MSTVPGGVCGQVYAAGGRKAPFGASQRLPEARPSRVLQQSRGRTANDCSGRSAIAAWRGADVSYLIGLQTLRTGIGQRPVPLNSHYLFKVIFILTCVTLYLYSGHFHVGV